MADVISFKQAKNQRKSRKKLCGHGFHKWKVWKDKQFDVKSGKLVTVYRCEGCDAQKVKTH
ncbi:hypothetical protein [Pleionea sp. CnH1-48]|uniref:hypothetical protein n=1 Tax=Pleionea sp. CnH1-48 TaxID=2954494 RepID=UPI0020969E4C|nr:hypothetical protein [Pleionea sp. CnH1-48]MCO7223170.1 hypothetical protein [Pleionea sp. CnH1-48]